MHGKKPVCTEATFACKAAWLFILVRISFENMAMKFRERRHSFKRAI
jgi:hypothetical protein